MAFLLLLLYLVLLPLFLMTFLLPAGIERLFDPSGRGSGGDGGRDKLSASLLAFVAATLSFRADLCFRPLSQAPEGSYVPTGVALWSRLLLLLLYEAALSVLRQSRVQSR